MNPLLLLLALGLGPQGAAPDPPPVTQAAAEQPRVWSTREVAAIDLLRSLRRKERPSDAELASRLAVGGEGLLPLLFEVLETRAVPAHDGGAPQALSEIQENVILLAVAQLGRSPVLAHASAQMLPGAEPARRLAALAFMGAVGKGNDLLELFELALPAEEPALDRRLEKVLQRAVTSILQRDPKAFEQLVHVRRLTRPALFPTLVRAVGAARDGAGLAFLADVAYWSPALIQDVLSQVQLVGLSSVESVNETMRVRLRPYLDDGQPGTCRAAILALVALADKDAIEPMIALLASEDEGLKENAHWGLCKLTGLALSPSRETWARWHQAELAWLLRSRTREFQRLRGTDPAEVVSALRGILTHPLALGELRMALPELLRHHAPGVRALACGTLAELRVTEAVEGLVWTLEDPDKGVVAAAYSALKKITGLDLPCEATAWQAATNSRPAQAAL